MALTSSPSLLELVVQTYRLLTKFHLPEEAVTGAWLKKGLGSHWLNLSGCETWTLLADSEKQIQAFQTKRLRKLLCISYLEHETNHWVQGKTSFLAGSQGRLLATLKEKDNH